MLASTVSKANASEIVEYFAFLDEFLFNFFGIVKLFVEYTP
jgi:hypothetical protein